MKNYNNDIGERIHKAEQLEIDFVKSQDGSPNYNDIENHISDIVDIFNNDEFDNEDEREDIEFMKEDLENEVDQCTDEIEDMHEDISMKINAIRSMIEQDKYDKKLVLKNIDDFITYINNRCDSTIDRLHSIV